MQDVKVQKESLLFLREAIHLRVLSSSARQHPRENLCLKCD